MAIIDWIKNTFGISGRISLDACTTELEVSILYKELAIQASINLIGNTLSRSEFLTFKEGEEIRGNNYYTFNIAPNQNKSSSKFWRDVVHKLVYENECLVVQIDKKLYLADSYDIQRNALVDNIYKDVIVDDYKLSDIFKESEVMHFELHNKDIRKIIESLSMDYSKLVKMGQSNFIKNNARRGILNVNTNYAKTEEARKDLRDLMEKQFKKFFNAEGGAVLPLTNGEVYEELISNIGIKGGIEGRDVREFINDIFDFTAIAFNIPPVLLKGEVAETKDVMSNYFTFCINPLSELLEDEINRKFYGKKLYLEKTYMRIDTTRCKNTDITDISASLDTLARSGLYTLNDGLRALGKEELSDKVGKQRFITRNYSTIEEIMEEYKLEGGE